MLTEKLKSVQFAARPGEIHLGIGHPEAALLPRDVLSRASNLLFKASDAEYLQYGAAAGDAQFRTELAGFLTKHYGVSVKPETLFITSGISQALDMLCATFSKLGDTIFVEEPSYFLALHIFKDHGLKLEPIPLDEHGLDIEVLKDKLGHHKPRFIYTIPIHQNPGGVSLSDERRTRLVSLAKEHDFLIFADEVYQLLSYKEDVPIPLAQFTDTGHVFSLGSFSKILAPGLRLGWVQTNPRNLEVLQARGVIRSGGGLNPFTSAIVKTAIREGLQENYLTLLKKTYKRRLNAMAGALDEVGLSYVKPEGGYFVWLKLPEGVQATKLLEVANHYNVNFQPGPKFSSQDNLETYIRLCFSYYTEDKLREGVNRLGQALNAY